MSVLLPLAVRATDIGRGPPDHRCVMTVYPLASKLRVICTARRDNYSFRRSSPAASGLAVDLCRRTLRCGMQGSHPHVRA